MSKILLLLGQYQIMWTAFARRQSGATIPLGNAHEIQFDGVNFGDNIFLGSYSDSMHVLDPALAHVCTSDHLKNVKTTGSTTYQLNGTGGNLSLPVPVSDTPLSFSFQSSTATATNAANVYAVDSADTGAMPNSSWQAVEGGVSAAWSSANGPAQPVRLVDHSPSTTHSFDVAVCMTPSARGQLTGKLKLTFNFV
jgi:hypothetical protein